MPTLGRYELLEELSSGSMGTVYLSRDTVLDRRVALKTILPGTNLDGELKERFYREARACAQLHHPSIVTIYDFGEQDGVAYIAMELLDGSTLKAIIQERKPIPLPRKIDLSARICDGLAHAHAKGVVHRDVKPSNILVVNESSVKILDFGIARTAASSLTVVGRVLGTPHYMAPEQILGKPCDARSDLFSAAIVIFELLSWTHPFQGQSIPRRIVRETADSLLSADPNLPAALGPVLAKGLAKEPEGRYQTGTEFAAALRAVLRDIAGSGTSTGGGLRTGIFDRPVEPPPPARKPRAGESTEFRMEEVLVLLREFDDAMDQNNVSAARGALKKIREAAEGDERFEGAVNQSADRLRELESQLPAAPDPPSKPEPKPVAAAPAPPPPPAPKPEYKPPVQTAPPSPPAPAAVASSSPAPPAPAPSSFGDATSLFSVGPTSASPAAPPRTEPPRQAPPGPRTEPPRPAAPQNPSALSGDSTRTQYHEIPRQANQPPKPAAAQPATPPVASPPPASPPPAAKPQAQAPPSPVAAAPKAPVTTPPATPSVQKPVRISPLIFIAAGVVFLLVAIGVFFYIEKAGGGNAPILPSVASAEVIAAQTNLMSSPLSGKAIATAHRGDRLNVLVAPRSASQEWSEVQFIQGRRSYARSYAHTADLGRWTSAKSSIAFQLVTLFGPNDLSNRDAVRDQLARLDAFIREFSGTPEEGKAHLEEARLHVALAKLAASPADAKPDLDAATSEVNKAANQPTLADEVTAEKQEIAAAGPTGATAAPPDGQAAAADAKEALLPPDVALGRANTYYQNGDYARAIRLLRQYPNSAPAQQLLQKVRRAQQIESGGPQG